MLNNKNNLVSVIIPAYNCANFIKYAIKSVLDQTYNNIELLVVDDGSTDNTSEIVKSFKNSLRYIYQKNGGVSKARNTGIEQSSGRYIAFLDADDIWDEKKLDIQMMCFQKYRDVNLIFSDFRHIKNKHIMSNMKYEQTFNIFREFKYDIKNFFECNSLLNHSGIKFDFFWGNIYSYLFLGNFILPSSVILKKDALMDVGLWNETYRVAEETEFFLRFSRNNNIGFIKYPLLYYELPEPDNLSGKKNTERLMKNALKIQIDSILENRNIYGNNATFYRRGLSMTYSRLAYYYLSEYRLRESRKYALFSIKTYIQNILSYGIFLSTFLPEVILQYMAKTKQKRNACSGKK